MAWVSGRHTYVIVERAFGPTLREAASYACLFPCCLKGNTTGSLNLTNLKTGAGSPDVLSIYSARERLSHSSG